MSTTFSSKAKASLELSKCLVDYVPSHKNDCSAFWDLQKKWIRDCSENHPACKSNLGDWMPTRVLDVEKGKYSAVRLIEPQPQAINGPCLTISHCWGQIEAIKLTTATIDSMRDGISILEPPALYQDAITVCRQLEIRYL